MIIIVGLGNPGKKFEKTRHNVGFLVIENLKLKILRQAQDGEQRRTIENFSDWENKKKFICEISQGEIAGKKIVLAKPQTFMNDSGKAVRRIIENWKLKSKKIPSSPPSLRRSVIENLFVVHDDIDLPLGKIKISAGRSSAGHKGIESIIKELGTKNFVRFRIGIKPQTTEKPADSYAVRRVRQNTKFLARFVLHKFNKEEEKILKKVIEKTVEAIEITIKEGLEKAMAKYNQ